MSSIVKEVLFGARQEVVLSPKEGYEVEAVEVFNKTTNKAVPAELTQTCENPPRWTCSFIQPAGVVTVRPKMKPICYSVIIEECDNCCVVLLESDDAVDIQMAVTNTEAAPEEKPLAPEQESGDEVATAGEPDNGPEEAFVEAEGQVEDDHEMPAQPSESPDITAPDAPTEQIRDEENPSANFNPPQHPAGDDEGCQDEASDVEDNTLNKDSDLLHDMVYDAGEFESELEETEPVVITRSEYDKKNESYWQHRKAFLSGQISKEEYDEVEKKHMQFTDCVSTGKIIVQQL